MTGVVKAVSVKRNLLVLFKDGCENDMTSNQLTAATVDITPLTEEAKMPTISTKPEKAVDLEKVYYHGVYVLLEFNKEEDVDTN